MATLKIIKKRIVSVKNTQKITKAMKLVSAAKLRRATEKAHSSRPYEEELLHMVSSILQDVEWKSPLIVERPENKVAFVVVSTDRGLCGSLNTNNFKNVLKRVSELPNSKIQIIALGKKANDFFRKRGFDVHSVYLDMARNGNFAFIESIAKKIRELFIDETFDRVEVFYSRFESAISQKTETFTLLPFVPPKKEGQTSFIYEPAAAELLDSLVPMLLDFRLFRVVLESVASEYGARMAAMDSATRNARDMIERLTLQRNRARQAAITKELMEIIGGAEALVA
ncbi:MAG: synthase subcomplex gamma subunit [Bacteriovoracaceae bacterium]|nr:synthase subcomplex gamma subunit [Bacteriovoracaceae bacterium]